MAINILLAIAITVSILSIYQHHMVMRQVMVKKEARAEMFQLLDEMVIISGYLVKMHKTWEVQTEWKKCQMCQTNSMLKNTVYGKL